MEPDDFSLAGISNDSSTVSMHSWGDLPAPRSLDDLIRHALTDSRAYPHDALHGAASMKQIGKFEVIREIGRGGYGTVFLVRDPDLDRERALKVPNLKTLDSTGPLMRFIDEGKHAARVEHRNVVRVYEAETTGLIPYIVMEYCSEGSLAHWLERRDKNGPPVSERSVAEFVAQIADGVSEAHLRGLLHRDLKPGNILLERTGSTGDDLSLFSPKIADFGLAKSLDSTTGNPSMTVSGTPLGTWCYMSPEQARGDRRIGKTTDVYAIGAILYELLTGSRLYEGLKDAELYRALTSDQRHRGPRAVRPDLDRNLERICLTCLEKLPSCRYSGPTDIAADLRRSLNGKSAKARPAAPFLRAFHWSKQHPSILGLVLALGIGLAFLPAGIAKVRENRAEGALQTLFAEEIEAAPKALGNLDSYRIETERKARALLRRDGPDSHAHALAVLILLHFDPENLETLHDHLLACAPREQLIVLNQIREHPPSDAALLRETERLWKRFEDTGSPPEKRLHAACYLANLCKEDLRWVQAGSVAADLLIDAAGASAALEENAHLVRLLQPMRDHLYPQLDRAFADVAQVPNSFASAWVLSRIAADDPELLAKYALEGDLRQFHILAAAIPHGDPRSLAVFRAEMADRLGDNTPLVTYNKRTPRMAKAAAMLIRDGRGEEVWPDLEETAVSVRFRPYLIQCMHEANISADQLLESLDSAAALTRRTLIQCLGSFPSLKISENDRQAIIKRFLGLYMTDPDPGVHSSLSWLLRKWQAGARVDQLNLELSKMGLVPNKGWYQESEGHTLAIIHGPSTVEINTAWTYPSPREERTIPYSFAIATKKVTVEQYERFLEKKKPPFASGPVDAARRHYDPALSPKPDCPINAVDFDHAARYCNWVSECNGIPAEQWCYEQDPTPGLERMRPVARFLEKIGYRLPTEDERVFACQAKTRNKYYFGPAAAMSSLYEWTAENSLTTSTESVGLMLPNDFGLHDMLALLREWAMAHPSRRLVGKQVALGGTFQHPAATLNARDFTPILETYAHPMNGLRIGRTVPSATGLSPSP